MGPNGPPLAISGPFRWKLDRALFLPTVSRRCDQVADTFGVVVAVEHAIGHGDRARASLPGLVVPKDATCLEVLGYPCTPQCVGKAVDRPIVEHVAPVVVFHAFFIEVVDLICRDFATLGREFYQGVSRFVGRGVVDLVPNDDRRGDHCSFVTGRWAGELMFARLGVKCHHPRFGCRDVDGRLTDVGFHDRNVLGGIFESFGLVDFFASLLVQTYEKRFATRGANQVISIDQNRFAVTPLRDPATEILDKVLAPDDRSVGDAQAGKIAQIAQEVRMGAIDGRCAARPASPTR